MKYWRPISITIHILSRSVYQYGIYIVKIWTRLVFSSYLLKAIYHLDILVKMKIRWLRASAALFSTPALWRKVNV